MSCSSIPSQMYNRIVNVLVVGLFFTALSVSAATSETTKTDDVSIKSIMAQQQGSEAILSGAKTSNDISVPKDDYNRGQPQGAMTGYIQAMRVDDLELAIQYLDFRNLSSKTINISQEELARQLWVVLSRTLWIDLNSISDRHLGDLNDNLPSYRELIGKVPYKEIDIPLYLQRIPRTEDRVKIWKISNATVEKIPQLFKQYSYSPMGEWLAKTSLR